METRAIKIAKTTRRYIIPFAKRHRFPKSMKGACALASFALSKALSHFEIENRFIIGDFLNNKKHTQHAFVVIENNALDITATQFGLGCVHIEKLNERYFVWEDEDLEKYLSIWPVKQNPYRNLHELNAIVNKVVEKCSITF